MSDNIGLVSIVINVLVKVFDSGSYFCVFM